MTWLNAAAVGFSVGCLLVSWLQMRKAKKWYRVAYRLFDEINKSVGAELTPEEHLRIAEVMTEKAVSDGD